jgi:protein gp37
MGADSKIEWTDHTFNPWIGCSKVHEGCRHCYAEADQDKFRGRAKWGPNGTRIKTAPNYWAQPRMWNRAAVRAGERARVFCASLADVFEDWPGMVNLTGSDLTMCCPKCGYGGPRPIIQRQFGPPPSECPRCGGTMTEPTLDGLRRMLFATIDDTPNLDWLLLTKRPENIPDAWAKSWSMSRGLNSQRSPEESTAEWAGRLVRQYVSRPNVWLGTSISDQASADKQIPALRKCRNLSPVLFLSVEPLLGPVTLELDGIDWVIVGGESGHDARPMRPLWVWNIRRQCHEAGVPFFFKQWGEWVDYDHSPYQMATPEHDRCEIRFEHGETFYRVGKKAAGRLFDGRTWDGFPQPLAEAHP